MKASPGPVVRKKPEARSHIVGSARKRRVSVLRRKVFLRASSVLWVSWGLLPWREEMGGVRVP